MRCVSVKNHATNVIFRAAERRPGGVREEGGCFMSVSISRLPEDLAERPGEDILLVAVWFGLVTGLVEGLVFLFVQQLGFSQQVSIEIVWVSALFDLVLLGALGIVLECANRLGKLRVSLRFALLLFVFLACLDWLAIGLAKWIHYAALLVLAAGLSMSFKRWFGKHDAAAIRFWRKSLPWVIAGTIAAFVAIEGGLSLRERVGTAGLPSASSSVTNILVVVVDSLRADHLSAYGYARRTSPNVDRLAQGGVLFENAFATSPWTLPSHVSLVTGRLPYEHGVGWQKARGLVSRRAPTVGEALMARGYRTAAFSANLFWFTRDRGFGRGFLHFEDYFHSFSDMLSRTLYGRAIEKFVLRPLGFEDIPGRKRASDINRAVLNWIDRDPTRPFFVFINYMDVHDPYLPPQPFRSQFSSWKDPGGILNWRVGRNNPQLSPKELQSEIDAYDGAISYVDHFIGRLVADVHKRGSAANTLVVITSDHGESFGEHGLFLHANSLYPNEIHVPLILSWPGRIAAGRRLAQPVTNAALPATLMDLIGADVRGSFPGPSLAKAWDAAKTPEWPPPIAEVEQIPWQPESAPAHHGSIKSLVGPRWQYVEHEKWGAEFYDLRNDPQAMRNLAQKAELQAFVAQSQLELRRRLQQLLVEGDGISSRDAFGR